MYHRSISPRAEARITGALYLISGFAFTYGENTVRARLIVPGNPAATAANIVANLPLYRAGLAADLASTVLFLAVTLLLYDLLRPVNPAIARIAVPFSLAGCFLQPVIGFFHFAPLLLLDPGTPLPFSPIQLQSMALESLKLAAMGTNVCMIFFGCFNLLAGYLIFHSRFMPRLIGVLLSFAGACYIVDYFAWVLSPALGEQLLRYLMWEGTAGEGSLILWLLIVGVHSQRWFDRAAAGPAPGPRPLTPAPRTSH